LGDRERDDIKERGVSELWFLTCERFEIPSTKQIASKMLLFPDPFNPVIALNCESNPEITVLVA
jgi:hypothetical protein